MRTTRTTLAVIAAVALSASLAVGASAQSAEPDYEVADPGALPPFAGVSGEMEGTAIVRVGDASIRDTLPEMVVTDDIYAASFETDDPRLSGTAKVNMNYIQFTTSELDGIVRSGLVTLTNDGGSWAGELRGFAKPGGSWHDSTHYAFFLTGEGGYAGLSAMLNMTPSGWGVWDIEGVIAPGPLPELPTSVDGPAE
jgi:hypothetical protein